MTTIAVIGGTGYAGSSIVKEAASRGHKVISLSRKLPAEQVEGVTYVQGSAADAADVIEGADVVVGALSPRAGTEGTLVETYTNLGRLAADNGARLFVIGGFSSTRPAPGAPRFAEGDGLPPEFAEEAREGNAVLTALIDNAPENLDWVFISPAATYGGYGPQGTPRGTYRTSVDIALFDAEGNSDLEGPDLALAVVDEIEKPANHRSQLHIAY